MTVAIDSNNEYVAPGALMRLVAASRPHIRGGPLVASQ